MCGDSSTTTRTRKGKLLEILVTGGAGYIGSTVCSALQDYGHQTVILDSLIKGKNAVSHDQNFYKGDISDEQLVRRIVLENPRLEAVIHCASLIVISESVNNPFLYYMENFVKSLKFFEILSHLHINKMVFSSTASIYGDTDGSLVTEDSPIKPGNPYAKTKAAIEMALEDFCHSHTLRAISLRYFNPIGADQKMRSGMDLSNSSHILGKLISAKYVTQKPFVITGTQWPTRDGTGIRDYIHVWDLAMAHVQALEKFDDIVSGSQPYIPINLGTGKGTTVLEMVEKFENVIGGKIEKIRSSPRPGDVAGAYANRNRAEKLLKWHPQISLEQAILDSIKWHQQNS